MGLIIVLLAGCSDSKETRVQRYLLQGNDMVTKRQPEQAERYFKEALKLDSCFADAWNNLAAAVERSGDLGAAAGYYARAIALRPDARASHFGLGRIYVNQGRYTEAISEFGKTIQPDDENTPGYLYALAAAHARAGHRKESMALLASAREKAAGRGQSAVVASIDHDLRSFGVTR